MGRASSGSYCRWKSKRPVAEDYCFPDINYLSRNGCLRPGRVSIQSWTCGDRDAVSVKLIAHENSIELDYRLTYAGKPEDVRYIVQLTHTACNYGGTGPWFRCPGLGCGRRGGELYAAGKYFLCRHCYGLAYSSQRMDELDRVRRKAEKIRKQLGADPYKIYSLQIEKPKGMHWSTYQRLYDEATHLAAYHAQLFHDKAAALVASLDRRLTQSAKRMEGIRS